jgi:uncharacterized protein
MNTYLYLITPFLAWFVAGSLKFIINSIQARKWAFDLVGNGGMPSNHSAIVSSTTMLIAIQDGIQHPAFGVALTLCFIVILDANSLRRAVGLHAQYLNELSSNQPKLRERMGHSRAEIFAGILVGCAVAYICHLVA